eukprot:CAMPEP_0119550902 /NCGR_PEP_ID=MMETSP1352-20130426/4334_1 /TAXON_ID=265584 /ORGANISM="Stauroneis constricta, Strain CCMP1120" /LENGTH=78 /DNA_ID=CAMNT_0007596889 /DNA_START=8 /DNA_END=244 /DNA_ORIENTATION=-
MTLFCFDLHAGSVMVVVPVEVKERLPLLLSAAEERECLNIMLVMGVFVLVVMWLMMIPSQTGVAAFAFDVMDGRILKL